MVADPGEHTRGVPVGAALARLRSDRKLSGAELGRVVGMSQAKISRIETGAGVPDPGDVAAIARALGAGEEEIRRLVEQAADRAQDRMTDWRLSPVGLAGRQRRMAQAETSTTTFRLFQLTAVFGLLQTSDYARAVLATYEKPLFSTVYYSSSSGLAEAVSERMRRQEVLADHTKQFRLVLAESALLHRISPPEIMPAQIQRIREVARQDNVSLRIIPLHSQWEVVPIHSFDLLDDRVVEVDLVNTGLTTQGKSDVRLYRQVFDSLEEQATTDIDPILDRYLELYLDLSRPPRRPLSGA